MFPGNCSRNTYRGAVHACGRARYAPRSLALARRSPDPFPMNALSVRGLTKTYRNVVQALKGVDLEVERCAFFALLDRKSTRLNSSPSQSSYADCCLKKRPRTRLRPGR